MCDNYSLENIFVKQAANQGTFTVYGDGSEPIRPFLHGFSKATVNHVISSHTTSSSALYIDNHLEIRLILAGKLWIF